MAHTLKAYYYTDPATAVTVDFYGAVADNDGIAVDAYQMGIPGIEQARNNSLYSDSPRPVYSKHGTVTDVLTVTVRGSTNTNLYTNLHLLAKLGECARRGMQNPSVNATPYLEFKPGGSAAGEVLYAMIYDCRVELPADWANSQDATLMIEDVTVTIERGIWRAFAPYTFNFNRCLNEAGVSLAASATPSVFYTGGDIPSLFRLTLSQSSGTTTINRFIIGYRSKALGGANHASLGKKEAESQTNGTDTSDAVDATASAGNKVECTFATPTIATRLSGTSIPYGVHRVFARMKVTGSAVATVNVKYQDTNNTNAVYVANSSVSVSSTSWLVYDLGVVRYVDSGIGAIYNTSASGVWSIDALLASGAGNLDIDYLFFMPTEGYITVSGFSTIYHATGEYIIIGDATNETMTLGVTKGEAYLRMSAAQYTCSLSVLPGLFTLYWLAGTDTGDVFDVGIVTTLDVDMRVCERFLMPTEI